jgi:hypothetical protein
MYWKLIREGIESPIEMVWIGRKAFCILFILQFTAVTFFLVALHDACLCGQACGHGLGELAETRDHGTHHDRCADSGCKSCNVEKMVYFGPNTLHKTYGGVRRLEALPLVAVFAEYFSGNHTFEHFTAICSGGDRDSPPVYLRNLSLLC